MPKFLKWILIGGISLLLLVIALFAALMLLVDPNDYKDRIAEGVKEATWRELTITGDLSWRLLPVLGVDVGAVALGNPAGFPGDAPFAAIEQVRVGVSVLALLQGRLEVGQVVISGAQVNLVKTATGADNWSDLAGPGAAAEEAHAADAPAPSAPMALAVGGVEIDSAQLSYHDLATGVRQEVSDLNVALGYLDLQSETPLTASVVLRSSAPQASLRVSIEASFVPHLAANRFELNWSNIGLALESTELPVRSATLNLTGKTDLDLAAGRVRVVDLRGGLRADMHELLAETLTAELGAALEYRLDAPQLLLEKLTLTALGTSTSVAADLMLADSGPSGFLDLTTTADTLAPLFTALQLDPGVALQAVKLSTRADVAAGATRVSLSPLSVSASALPAGQPQPLPLKFAATPVVDLQKATFSAPDITVSLGDTRVLADIGIQDLLSAPRITYQLSSPPSDLRLLMSRLGLPLPPMQDDKNTLNKVGFEASGNLSGDSVKVQSMRLRLDESTLTGTASAALGTPAQVKFALALDRMNVDRYLPPETAPAPPAEQPEPVADDAGGDPFVWMDWVTLDGKVEVGQVSVAGVELKNTQVGVTSDGRHLRVDPLDTLVWGARQQATVTVERADPPLINVTESLDIASIAQVFEVFFDQAFVDGRTKINLAGNMRGLELGDILRTMQASGDFSVLNGSFKRINLMQEIRQAKATFLQQPFQNASPARSTFDDMKGAFAMSDGKLNLNQINLTSKEYQATGDWAYDTQTGGISAALQITVPESAKASLPADLRDLVGVTFPLRVSGNVTDPKVAVDMTAFGEVLKQRAKEKAKEELERKAQEKLAPIEQKIEKKVGGEVKEQLKNLLKF